MLSRQNRLRILAAAGAAGGAWTRGPQNNSIPHTTQKITTQHAINHATHLPAHHNNSIVHDTNNTCTKAYGHNSYLDGEMYNCAYSHNANGESTCMYEQDVLNSAKQHDPNQTLRTPEFDEIDKNYGTPAERDNEKIRDRGEYATSKTHVIVVREQFERIYNSVQWWDNQVEKMISGNDVQSETLSVVREAMTSQNKINWAEEYVRQGRNKNRRYLIENVIMKENNDHTPEMQIGWIQNVVREEVAKSLCSENTEIHSLPQQWKYFCKNDIYLEALTEFVKMVNEMVNPNQLYNSHTGINAMMCLSQLKKQIQNADEQKPYSLPMSNAYRFHSPQEAEHMRKKYEILVDYLLNRIFSDSEKHLWAFHRTYTPWINVLIQDQVSLNSRFVQFAAVNEAYPYADIKFHNNAYLNIKMAFL